MSVDYKSLQNGSDIRGVALATEGSPVTLGEEETKKTDGSFRQMAFRKDRKTRQPADHSRRPRQPHNSRKAQDCCLPELVGIRRPCIRLRAFFHPGHVHVHYL